MKNISAKVSIFCLWTNWIHLVTCSRIEFRDLHCCSHCALDKIFEIYTFDSFPHGWSGQKSVLACGDVKKRIGEQLNYFWKMRLKPFSWAKDKRKLFLDGKSRGPLLARAALKMSSDWFECVLVVFFYVGRVFSESVAKSSSCFTNVKLIAISASYPVNNIGVVYVKWSGGSLGFRQETAS